MSLALVFPVGTALAWLLAQASPLAPVAVPAVPSGVAAPFLPAVRPHIHAVRTSQRPVIDGKLDDPAWRRAVPSDTFTQHFPNEGAPPSERTEVRILYDDTALYIGVDCEQVHAPVVKRLMRRDTQAASDGVWLDIDSRRDGVSAFHFGVNAAGVLSDAIHFNDLEYSADWDAVWEGKASDTPRGYSVEIRIPLYVLRFDALPVQDWGFELRRFIEARQETDDWAFFPRSAGSYIPMFGRIDDLADLRPRHAWQLRPFELGRLRHRSADAIAAQGTLAQGWDAKISGGLDTKVAVTNDLTLDLALLPDFGQVEADSVVLNLSTFETFFPEKRPLFLEGIDTFATLRQLLYTRRIGHQPASPTLGAGEKAVDLPDPSPIYGAAKLVGAAGASTTLGVLSAVTGQNDVDVRTNNGATVARTAEPLSAYNVVRWKRLVGADSSVGLLATATNRFEPLYAVGQLCPSTQAKPATDQRCTNDAYALSADGRWRSPRGDYVVSAQALTTALVHGPVRAETDGINVNPGTLAGGGTLNVDRVGGKHWLWNIDQQVSGRQLEFNDLGYLDRKNDYLGNFALTYRTIEPWWKTVETRTTLQADVRRTLDGIDLQHGFAIGSYWILSSFWTLLAQADYRGAWHDDRELGNGVALERAARWGGELTLAGDPRRRVLWSVYGQALHITDGGHYEAHGDLTLRALPQLELELVPTATYDEGEPRYFGVQQVSPTAAFVFGAQEARSLGATLRAAYTFTPELSLQVYSQAFLARVHYTRFFQSPVVAPRQRIDLSSLVALAPPSVDPDTLTATLNVNVVLRWEFRLGSTAFLVYTRSQTPALVPAMGGATSLDLHPILNGRAAIDVIMLKIAYWFG
ncbi:MAG TPA: DUF5916 domain-containing protein [Polyangia bacterium]|nr:DUF5916 domain-containing protein [Polyangia bacterium]